MNAPLPVPEVLRNAQSLKIYSVEFTAFGAVTSIPTPSILFCKPVIAVSAKLKFKTDKARIRQLSFNDGQTNIQLPIPDPFTSASASDQISIAISPPHLVQSALSIGLDGIIDKAGKDEAAGYIELVAFGIEFQFEK